MVGASESPRPRAEELVYAEWKYDVLSVDYLPHPGVPPEPAFFRVLEARRSWRQIGELSRDDLSALLWFTAKTRESVSRNATRWEHRSVPSAGGRHPIDSLIFNWPVGSNALHRYDPLAHALCTLHIQDVRALEMLRDAAANTVQSERAVLIWHAAQFARTTSKYANGESLVWRDAGALVAVTALVSEALGLACCPLGITGEPYLSTALGAGSDVQGVGACMVGVRIA